jgi:hypothetical protein
MNAYPSAAPVSAERATKLERERSSGRFRGGQGGDDVVRGRLGCDDSSGEATFSLETVHLDLPGVAVALSQRLWAAGIPVTPGHAVTFLEALALVGPVSRRRLYCTARAVFVSSRADLPAFDSVFLSIFDRSGVGPGSW